MKYLEGRLLLKLMWNAGIDVLPKVYLKARDAKGDPILEFHPANIDNYCLIDAVWNFIHKGHLENLAW